MSMEKEPSKELANEEEFDAFLKDLPQERNFNDWVLYLYQGLWAPKEIVKGVIHVQKSFIARDDDIIVTSCPKAGTTWLKALVFAISNRTCDDSTLTQSPLLHKNSHDLVPFLETTDLWSTIDQNPSKRRLFSTHMPYSSLPTSIKASHCKLVYISRNPMDLLASMWHFLGNKKITEEQGLDLETCFDKFCHGIYLSGPVWDHVLGFWKASLERPEKILFLKYEDVKMDTFSNVKKLAEFLGFPFSEEEEKRGVVEEIIGFCSLGRMKNMEGNKRGEFCEDVPYSKLFRKGEVGDSKSILTSTMIERMQNFMHEKYAHYPSLSFKFSS